MTSATDPEVVKQTTTYDRRGHVAAVTNAAGGFQQTYYDSMERPSQTTDSDGVYTNYAYDLAGQLLEQVKPRSTTDYVEDYWEDRTTYTYNADGQVTSTVDPRGNVPGANPAGFTTTVTYDADGRPVASMDPLGRTVTTGYDIVGRPVTVTDPAGNVTTTVYNKVGWPTSVTAPVQGMTRYYYNSVGSLTKRLDSMSRATTYTYDAAGRQLTQTDPLGRVTSMSYDVVGNVKQVVKPSGTATAGDLTDGMVSYAYDAANRPVSTSFSDATAGFTFDYSPAGRVVSAARVQNGGVSAASEYTYDDAGRKTSVVRTGPGGSEANYSYTTAGRLSGAAWSTGASEAYSYNSVGELTSVTPSGVAGVGVVQYGYDPSGRVVTVTRQGPTPVTTSAVFDVAGQLASLQHSSSSGVLEGYAITRDTRGNPTEVTTTTATSTSSAVYGYDAVSRLTSECYPAVGVVCGSNSPSSSYTYDKVGNRATESSRTVVGSKATTVKTVYAYDAASQLLTESVGGVAKVTNTWTPNGVLASSTTPQGTTAFTSDLMDELTSLTLPDGSTVGYTTDTSGNRTSRTVDGVLDVSWVWDELSALPVRIGETDATGTLTSSWLPDPASSTGTPLAETTGGVSNWMLSDPFLNVAASVSMTGTVSGTKTLDAFGETRTTATGTLADSAFGFAGQYLDDATGMYDMRARDYNPSSGRFTAMDAVAVPTGTPYFAGYTYGYNNPLMFTDPTGLTAACSGTGANEAKCLAMYYKGTGFSAAVSGQNTYPCASAGSTTAGRRAVEIGYETMNTWLNDDLSKYFSGYSDKGQLNLAVRCGAKGGVSLSCVFLMNKSAKMILKLRDLQTKFQPYGPWDVKPILVDRMNLPGDSSDPTRNLDIGSGQTMYYDVIGNVQYGFMMSAYGVTEEGAILASKAKGSGNPDSSDDVAIRIGYEMRAELGDNFTAAGMYDFILSSTNRQKLVAAGKIHGNVD